MKQWDKGHEWEEEDPETSFKSWKSAYIEKLAVIEAATITAQKTANSHLEALGFTKLGPFPKLKHPGNDLFIWVIPATDLMKAVGYEGVSEKIRNS